MGKRKPKPKVEGEAWWKLVMSLSLATQVEIFRDLLNDPARRAAVCADPRFSAWLYANWRPILASQAEPEQLELNLQTT
jgi:hypothetical protein